MCGADSSNLKFDKKINTFIGRDDDADRKYILDLKNKQVTDADF
jgi:hypothetical protein